jgi:hypothetical protein
VVRGAATLHDPQLAIECFADLDAFTACLERDGFAVESMENTIAARSNTR